MYGLLWDCVDYERNALILRRSATKGVLNPTTKSATPRLAPLLPSLASHLREHRKAQIENDHPGLAINAVYPSRNGKFRYASSIRQPMNNVAEKMELDVKVGPQVLRRTVNTELRAAGIDSTLILQQIGHTSNEEMGLHYSRHRSESMIAAMESVFGDAFEL